MTRLIQSLCLLVALVGALLYVLPYLLVALYAVPLCACILLGWRLRVRAACERVFGGAYYHAN